MHTDPRKFYSILLLVLLLVAGPLQAQALFACEMMGVTFEECCCDDLDGAPDRANDHAQYEPCCEQIVEIGTDPDAVDVIQPIEVRSDVDPPTAISTAEFGSSLLVGISHQIIRWTDDGRPSSGQQTYLITQRLRI